MLVPGFLEFPCQPWPHTRNSSSSRPKDFGTLDSVSRRNASLSDEASNANDRIHDGKDQLTKLGFVYLRLILSRLVSVLQLSISKTVSQNTDSPTSVREPMSLPLPLSGDCLYELLSSIWRQLSVASL